MWCAVVPIAAQPVGNQHRGQSHECERGAHAAGIATHSYVSQCDALAAKLDGVARKDTTTSHCGCRGVEERAAAHIRCAVSCVGRASAHEHSNDYGGARYRCAHKATRVAVSTVR